MQYRSIALLSLIGFTLLALPSTALTPREDKDDLTLEWAQFRRAQVASVAYDLALTFQEGAKTFEGRVTLSVTLNATDAPLSIDLKAEAIHAVAVNGVPVDNVITRKGSFDIPAEHLSSEPMNITVDYTGTYSNTREGLIHYTDPVDGREYFYTNLEPYGAHLVFPCFDQPDLKATYTLTVDAPASWVMMGNSLPETSRTAGGRQSVRFKTTPPLSTYLFFVGGGNYRVWRDTHNGLPLTLYARESLAEYFDAERLFSETKAGLDYFNEYFGTAYPFDQYGHIFAPELGPGAMENPGAVTMNEYMIFRGAPTDENFRGRNNTLLHEMAHMWFGNLVTMAWWNDLWLNESFATFSAYQAQAAIGAYTGIWERFYETKGWAYYQDQLSTTHPVEVDVPTAQMAMANFDGITYAKGASALKQLSFHAGPEAYQLGVAAYFRKYAWQNATRTQFMQEIAAAAGLELDLWAERWLKTEGLARMEVEFACEQGAIESFTIQHAPVNAPALSPHRTQIALFDRDASGKLLLREVVPAGYQAPSTPVDALIGKPCPDFVYPNYGDMDYGLFFLDARSYATVSGNPGALEDPFMRRMVWGTLYSMVRHQELRASELMVMLLDNIPRETDPDLLEFLLGNRPTRDVFLGFLSLERSLEFAPRLETLLWNGFQAAQPGSDSRLHWLDAYVGTASRRDEEARLRSLLETETGGEALDQPRRWQVVRKLAQIGAPDVEALLASELERDPTDQGKRNEFSIRGAIPTLEAKRAQWERLKDPELSLSYLRAGASTFYNRLYPELNEAFVDDWFAYVASRDWEAEQHRIVLWFNGLLPPVYTPEFLARSRAALGATTLPGRARRTWQESNDAIARIVAIRAHDTAAGVAGP